MADERGTPQTGAARPGRGFVVPRSLYYVVGKVFFGIGQIVLIKVLTSTLKASEIGKYYLLMSVVSLMSLVFVNPIYMYLTRHFVEWHRAGAGWTMARRFILYVGAVALVAGLLAAFLGRSGVLPMEGVLLALVPVLVFCTTLSTVPNELYNLIGRMGFFNVMVNVELWGRVGFIAAVFLFLPHAALTVAGGLALWGAVMSAAAGLILYLLTRRHPSAEPAETPVVDPRAVFGYAWPFALSIGLYWCQSDGYRIALQFAGSVDSVGLFVVAFSLGATFMVAIDSLVHQIYLPGFYQEIAGASEEGYRRAWEGYARNVVGIFVPCACFIACGGPFLARWILHSEYWGLGIYAAFGAFAQLFRIFSSIVCNGIYAYKKTSSLLLPNLIGAVAALLLVFLAGRFDPIIGTGGALVFSYFLVSAGLTRKFLRLSGAQLPVDVILKSLVLVAPVCLGLLAAGRFGLARSLPGNLLTLACGGLALLAILYRTSRSLFTART